MLEWIEVAQFLCDICITLVVACLIISDCEWFLQVATSFLLQFKASVFAYLPCYILYTYPSEHTHLLCMNIWSPCCVTYYHIEFESWLVSHISRSEELCSHNFTHCKFEL